MYKIREKIIHVLVDFLSFRFRILETRKNVKKSLKKRVLVKNTKIFNKQIEVQNSYS
jgi:hypothetical protein